MNKILYSIFFLTLIFSALAQNKIKPFELDYTGKKIDNGLYNSIKYLDSREDTSNMGIVRIGALNKEALVTTNGNFSVQLNDLLKKINGVDAQQNEVLFQLRRLKFVEKEEEEGSKEHGYCFFRASLYANKDNAYQLISSIDTFIVVVESGDITNLILEEANNAIVYFLSNALKKQSTIGSILTWNEITKIDSVEKIKIKLYNVEKYTDGVYKTFMAFKAQIPDYSLFSITFEDGEITEIKAKNRKGKVRRIRKDNVYAIVNNGKPFISAQFGYYPLVKNNNDFYFIGDDKLHFIKGQIAKSTSIFDTTDYLYTPIPITSYEIKIDHVNGKFMRVRELKK
ncbi:MAG: hypothetical protein Q8L81_14230 [Bacteroidota bacterium]|nr:hypothetical protein [Bacteroidota bacterium]